MKTLHHLSVSTFLLLFSLPVVADDLSDTLRDRIRQVLDDSDLSELERFQALREVLNEEESVFVSEYAARWTRALSSPDFDARNDARQQLANAGVLALPALEDGVRTGDLETSNVCLQLVDRLARSEVHSEAAISALERLSEDDDEATAAKASDMLAAVRSFYAEHVVQAAIDRIVNTGGRVDFDEHKPGTPPRRIYVSSGGGFDDSLLECVASTFPELDSLHVNDAKITDAGMVHLSQMRNLRNLSLDGAQITDEGLTAISGLTGLEDLSLSDTEVTDDGLRHVMELKSLSNFSLTRTGITDAGLMQLKDLPNIERLSLGLGGSITDDGLRHLQEFPRLKTLTLGTDFTDFGMEHIAAIANLERLAFISCEGITDFGLQHLSSVTTLKSLSIYSRDEGGVTEAGLEELQQALPELRIGGRR